MSSYSVKKETMCLNDCKMSGCPGHNIELKYQDTSDHFTFIKDGEAVFSVDILEMEKIVNMYNILTNNDKGQANLR